MADSGLLDTIVAALGIAIIAFLAGPGVLNVFSKSAMSGASAPEDPGKFYEDQDGEATEKSVRDYSDIIPRIAVWVSATAGFGAAIALGVVCGNAGFSAAKPHGLSVFNAWADTIAWVRILGSSRAN